MNNKVASSTVIEAMEIVSKERQELNFMIRKDKEANYTPSAALVALAKQFAKYKSTDLVSIATALKIFLEDPANNYYWLSKAVDEIEAL